jgi:mRNA interferase MazF
MVGLRRGAIAAVAAADARWMALIVQSDHFLALSTVVALPLTRDLIEARLLRVTLAPTAENGLPFPVQAMIDAPATVAVRRVGQVIGHADGVTMREVGRALLRFYALAG